MVDPDTPRDSRSTARLTELLDLDTADRTAPDG
jgi:hypothetical protein